LQRKVSESSVHAAAIAGGLAGRSRPRAGCCRRRRGAIWRLGALAALLLPVHAPLDAQVRILDLDETVDGRTVDEWIPAWWSWVAGIPEASHPLLDSSGVHCAQGQVEPEVVFLAGTLGGSAVRECRFLYGKHFFFPVLNAVRFSSQDEDDCASLCSTVQGAMDPQNVSGLKLAIDGQDFSDLLPSRRRGSSGCFSVDLHPQNVYGLPVEFGRRVCTDGYWVMISPLDPGFHQLSFSSESTSSGSMEVVYDLFIQALEFQPALVDFGQVSVGDSHRRRLQVTNLSPDPIEVRSADLIQSPALFSIDRSGAFSIGGGEAVELVLAFTPEEAGPKSAVLALDTSAGVFEIPVQGEGANVVFVLDFAELSLEGGQFRSGCRLATFGLLEGSPGAQGWTLGLSAGEPCRVVAWNFDGVEARAMVDPDEGFVITKIVPEGVVSAVVFNRLDDSVTLIAQPEPKAILSLVLTLDADAAGCAPCAIRYRDGLLLDGVPVTNAITYERRIFRPRVADRIVDLCVQPLKQFRRGDTNGDGKTDLSDAVRTLGFLFQGFGAPTCAQAADANGDTKIDIADAVFTLNFLFIGAAEPPPPFHDCGLDPESEHLGCASSPCAP
jgi:hypothetical protein